jgi:hypothetical protein
MTWLKAGLVPSYKVKGSRAVDLAVDSAVGLAVDSGIDLAVDSAVGLAVTQQETRQSVQEL